jgi:prepilin-type N-terminal cleavage/methylation domain-containing protein
MNAATRGFSLVELMIAMTIGLVMTAGIMKLFETTLLSNRDLIAGKHLESELHGTLDLISRDLRRIGAMGNPLAQMAGTANPFAIDAPSAFGGEAASSCLTYSYDLNGNGSIDTASTAVDERLGYRLRSGAVQIRRNGQACTATPHWTNVTTSTLVQVTTLRFTLTSTTQLGVTQRLITVDIAGRLVTDASVARTLTRTVRLRNDV